jgi:AcrR family transcriptional regulator
MQSQLFKSTLELLHKRGYAGLRIAEVARHAGVSSGALLHYFKSKNELLLAAAAHALDDELAQELKRAAHARSNRDPVRAMIEGQKSFYLSRFFMVMWELSVAARDNPELEKTLRTIRRDFRAKRRTAWRELLVARGIAEGSADAMLEATIAYWAGFAMQFLLDRSLLPKLDAQSKEAGAQLETMIRALSKTAARTRRRV